jgi:hypothetical protein
MNRGKGVTTKHATAARTKMTKFEHTFRQSELGTWMMCPEQFRLNRAGLMPRQETEATAVGTSVHAAIEAVLKGEATADTGMDVALETWDSMIPNIDRWVKASPQQCAVHVSNCYSSWADTVYPALPPIERVEGHFNVPLHEDDQRVIRLSGTVDALDADGTVWDWKTAASLRSYNWEKQRFAVQPTVYTYAAAHPEGFNIENPTFAYAVMEKAAKPVEALILRITRDSGHWDWLTKQAISLAVAIEAEMPIWQLNDQGWHCSPRWCGAWDSCKGAHVEGVA